MVTLTSANLLYGHYVPMKNNVYWNYILAYKLRMRYQIKKSIHKTGCYNTIVTTLKSSHTLCAEK